MKEVECPFTIKYCEVTPKDAEELLSTNFEMNRRINKGLVDKYVEDIRRGIWSEYVCDPIHISNTGKLLNGQHRMSAIVRTGTPLRMEVRFGIPENEYKGMDQGKKRTAGDAISAKNQNSIAALCRVCISVGARKKITQGSFDTGGTNARRLSNTNTALFYEAFEERYPGALEEVVSFSKTEACRKTGWTSTAFALPFLAVKISSPDLYNSFREIVEGEDNTVKSVFAFKTWQVRNNKGKVKKGSCEERYISWCLAARVCEYLATGKDAGYTYKKGATIASRMPFFRTEMFDLFGYQEEEK